LNNSVTESTVKIKMFVVAVRSAFVRNIYLEPFGDTIPESSKFDDCSVILGVTGGETSEEAIRKLAGSYDLPEESLISYELAY
jgi:hypothetical protein